MTLMKTHDAVPVQPAGTPRRMWRCRDCGTEATAREIANSVCSRPELKSAPTEF